jgi:hypothetical protein
LRSWNNQVSSQQTVAIDRYSASAKELETIVCFLDFQEIKESPRKTQNPKTDLRVSRQLARSKSQKAFKKKKLKKKKRKKKVLTMGSLYVTKNAKCNIQMRLARSLHELT